MNQFLLGLSLVAIVATAANAKTIGDKKKESSTQIALSTSDNAHFKMLISANEKGNIRVKLKDESGEDFSNIDEHVL